MEYYVESSHYRLTQNYTHDTHGGTSYNVRKGQSSPKNMNGHKFAQKKVWVKCLFSLAKIGPPKVEYFGIPALVSGASRVHRNSISRNQEVSFIKILVHSAGFQIVKLVQFWRQDCLVGRWLNLPMIAQVAWPGRRLASDLSLFKWRRLN